MAGITRSAARLQNSPIFAAVLAGMGCEARQSRMSGWMPMARSSLTLCWWAGLEFARRLDEGHQSQ